MMRNVLEEGKLQFDFSSCGIAERFDDHSKNSFGMKAVDFVVETSDCLYFIEVKDFQHPNAPLEQRLNDYKMLIAATEEGKSVFNLEMGAKIKDSLLRRYAEGFEFTKKVVYLLLINLDNLGEYERGLLKLKISGHIPTGLKDPRFSAFKEISFDLLNAKNMKQYGIICTAVQAK